MICLTQQKQQSNTGQHAIRVEIPLFTGIPVKSSLIAGIPVENCLLWIGVCRLTGIQDSLIAMHYRYTGKQKDSVLRLTRYTGIQMRDFRKLLTK